MPRQTRLGASLTVSTPRGNTIACQIAGPPTAQPVILTSGIGCGPVFFKHIGPELASDYRTIFWDYRAHGASDLAPDGRSYRVEDHADDLDAVIRHLTDRPPILVGFSMGVQVTMEWIARHKPSGVPACVFLLGAPRNPLRSHWLWGNARMRASADRALDAGLDRVVRSLHPLSKAILRSRLSYEVAVRTGLVSEAFSAEEYDEFIHYSSGVRPDAWLRSGTGVLAHDALEAWKRLDIPSLYIAGAQDLLVPAGECRSVAHLPKDVLYEELLGRSHAGTVEARRHLARKIRAFIDGHLREVSGHTAVARVLPVKEPRAKPTLSRSIGAAQSHGFPAGVHEE